MKSVSNPLHCKHSYATNQQCTKQSQNLCTGSCMSAFTTAGVCICQLAIALAPSCRKAVQESCPVLPNPSRSRKTSCSTTHSQLFSPQLSPAVNKPKHNCSLYEGKHSLYCSEEASQKLTFHPGVHVGTCSRGAYHYSASQLQQENTLS